MGGSTYLLIVPSLARLSRVVRARVPLIGALLMLAVVLCHAVVPAPAPFERVRGSAFSAATADVSTAPQRDEGAVEAAVIVPPAPARVARPVPAMPAAAPIRRIATDFAARAPPVRGLFSAIVPSGPPAA